MNLELTGKTALVLGAGGGLGGAIAQALAREGAQIAAADRDFEAAQRTAHAIEAAGGRAVPLKWDLGDLTAVDANVGAVESALGPVDILVNNTGGPPPTTAHGQALELWSQHFQRMVLSVIAITDRVLPQYCSDTQYRHWLMHQMKRRAPSANGVVAHLALDATRVESSATAHAATAGDLVEHCVAPCRQPLRGE